MATRQELELALVNADRAGDADAARKIAAVLRVSSEQNPSPTLALDAFVAPPQKQDPYIESQVIGAAEAARATVQNTAAGVLGIGAQLSAIVSNILNGKFFTQEPYSRAAQERQYGQDVAASLSYQPSTELGREYAENVGRVMEGLTALTPAFISPKMGAQARNTPQVPRGMVADTLSRALPGLAAVGEEGVLAGEARLMAGRQATPGKPPREKSQTPSSPEDVLRLAGRAEGPGAPAQAARQTLAESAKVNPEAQQAASRLKMDLPTDVLSDSPQFKETVGLVRGKVGGEASADWGVSIKQAAAKADEALQKIKAEYVSGSPSPGMTSSKIRDTLNEVQRQLEEDAAEVYSRVESQVPPESPASFSKTKALMRDIIKEVGEKNLTKEERSLLELANDPTSTYGALAREKRNIGATLGRKSETYKNVEAGYLKRLYGAMAEDELATVKQAGGDVPARQLEYANSLVKKRKAIEDDLVSFFGQGADGSIGGALQTAIKQASKGDSTKLTSILKIVPAELRKETLATGIASLSQSARATQQGFGFSEYAKLYRGLRANPPVYSEIVKTLGEKSDQVLRDLYEISTRVADSQSKVLTTGKANQIIDAAQKAEGLVGRIMEHSLTQRAATAAASLIPGGGIAAPDIIRFMANANKDTVQAAAKVFASPEFQQLAIEVATQMKPSTHAVNAVANSKTFYRYAKLLKLPLDHAAKAAYVAALASGERKKGL